MKIEAKVIYIILPSKLKEYPSGKTKLVIFGVQPKFSNSTIVFGKAASELLVLKANKIGSLIRFISSNILLFKKKEPAKIKTPQSKNNPK